MNKHYIGNEPIEQLRAKHINHHTGNHEQQSLGNGQLFQANFVSLL